jgi:hypothetical protein
LAVFAQKRAFVNQFATEATTMALPFTGLGNRFFHILGLETTQVESAKLSENLTQKPATCYASLIPNGYAAHTAYFTYLDGYEKSFKVDPPQKQVDDFALNGGNHEKRSEEG